MRSARFLKLRAESCELARHKSNAPYGNHFASKKMKAERQIGRSGLTPVATEPGIIANDSAGKWLKEHAGPTDSFWRRVKRERKTRERMEKRRRAREGGANCAS